jgi:hypothetical protein
MFPVEIVKAFEPDLAAVYLENHAALLILIVIQGRAVPWPNRGIVNYHR